MEFKGTKGNWQIDIDHPTKVRCFENNDESHPVIADASLESYLIGYRLQIRKEEKQGNIKTANQLRDELLKYDSEQYANAQLIAAAPELLEKLQDAVKHMDQVHNGESLDYDVVYECREAINKALGTN